MAQPGHVRLSDLRDIYRLVGECRDFRQDPAAWRSHMLDGLRRLTGAQVAIGGEVALDGATGAVLANPPPVEVGWATSKARERFLDYLRDNGPTGDPMLRRIMQAEGLLVTRSRDQLFDDRAWYHSVHFNEYHRISEVDAIVQSHYRLRDGGTNVICLMRALGDAPFSPRERRMLHLFHHELGPLIGPVLKRESASSFPLPPLSPRLRQTLDCLLRGQSEKQTAEVLGISRATAHQYITTLYRLFGVHSKGQLLALWVPVSGGPGHESANHTIGLQRGSHHTTESRTP